MFLSDLAGVLERRWYLIITGALLTAGAANPAVHTEDRYLASEILMIQPPVSPYEPNPVTGLFPSIAVTAAAVANRLNTPDSQEMFRAKGVTGTYRFEPRNTGTRQEPRYVIGSMAITNISTDEDAGLRSLQLLSDTFEQELKRMQDEWNVRKGLRITVATLVPATSTLLTHSPLRSLIGVGLLGALATSAVTLWTDELLRRRRRRATASLSTHDSPNWTDSPVRSAP
ncbi:hypothetical protein [Actinoplanes teichomyceticus]|uniref:Capsular polysaccharide biosynthesis protein n=1 Tax=Actinoplanes teichomyceticus TaxID=1867 RepID=A0A561VL95_ACTTI|nr:hypothetical protein [Actinoplanes teichomyceticus]TWG12388.1 hypothetical protein FHX34_105255 [Actinoplanes teichomyceticus]GIF13748.1 hypothetical protein Ate01nite_37800 [Actinoplanes teichomyceticus]